MVRAGSASDRRKKKCRAARAGAGDPFLNVFCLSDILCGIIIEILLLFYCPKQTGKAEPELSRSRSWS